MIPGAIRACLLLTSVVRNKSEIAAPRFIATEEVFVLSKSLLNLRWRLNQLNFRLHHPPATGNG
jgi:hypothetical protein